MQTRPRHERRISHNSLEANTPTDKKNIPSHSTRRKYLSRTLRPLTFSASPKLPHAQRFGQGADKASGRIRGQRLHNDHSPAWTQHPDKLSGCPVEIHMIICRHTKNSLEFRLWKMKLLSRHPEKFRCNAATTRQFVRPLQGLPRKHRFRSLEPPARARSADDCPHRHRCRADEHRYGRAIAAAPS